MSTSIKQYFGLGSQGNVGVWTGESFNNLDLDNWQSVQMSLYGDNMYIIGNEHNVGYFNCSNLNEAIDVKDLGILGGWTINSLAFAPDGTLWCVGTNGNIGSMANLSEKWTSQPKMDAHTMNCIAINNVGVIYAVGTDTKVYNWTGTDWNPNLNINWNVKSTSFDAAGRQWFVGTNGNIGRWSTEFNTMLDYGKLDNWELIAFV